MPDGYRQNITRKIEHLGRGMMADPKIIREGLSEIFSGIAKLKAGYGHRHFTIDGKLVGDIGEVIAEQEFDIRLTEKSVTGYDAQMRDFRRVEVKATFKDNLLFRSIPDYCIGLKLSRDGTHEVVFNGPGRYIAEGFPDKVPHAKNQVAYTVKQLARVSALIPEIERVPRISREPWPEDFAALAAAHAAAVRVTVD
ncbi:MAG: hypothetical protein AB1631_26665 [Acidobacteriota bacterium]